MADDDALALCLELTESKRRRPTRLPKLPPARPVHDYIAMSAEYSKALKDDRRCKVSYLSRSQRSAERSMPLPETPASPSPLLLPKKSKSSSAKTRKAIKTKPRPR